MADLYERVSLVKPEVFIYRIPPRASNRAVRAADWNLSEPEWKGRMRVVSLGDKCMVKLEDKISGELFALCPVDKFPGIAVEPVSDSSRYFLLRLQDASGQNAFVGLGFEDRGDAFDFNVALQDHFKKIKQEESIAAESTQPVQHKDYSLKQGQKIQINFGKKVLKNEEEAGSVKSQASVGLSASGGLLPPPSSSSRPVQPQTTPSTWGGGGAAAAGGGAAAAGGGQKKGEEWGDFAAFESQGKPKPSGGDDGWVQF